MPSTKNWSMNSTCRSASASASFACSLALSRSRTGTNASMGMSGFLISSPNPARGVDNNQLQIPNCIISLRIFGRIISNPSLCNTWRRLQVQKCQFASKRYRMIESSKSVLQMWAPEIVQYTIAMLTTNRGDP